MAIASLELKDLAFGPRYFPDISSSTYSSSQQPVGQGATECSPSSPNINSCVWA